MSFEIFWDKLDSDIALSFQNYLNNYFKDIKRPDFLGEVVFSDADFGQIPPEITITDICDPMPEFYDEQLGGNDSSYLNSQEDYPYENEVQQEFGEDYYIPPIDDMLPSRHNEWSSNFNRLSFNGFSNSLNNQNFYRTSSLQNLGQNFNVLSLSDITSVRNDNTTENTENTKKSNKPKEMSKSFYSDISFDFNNLTSFLLRNTIGEVDNQSNATSETENDNNINNTTMANTTTNSNNNNNNNNNNTKEHIIKSIASSSQPIITDILKNELDIGTEEEISSIDHPASTVDADAGSEIETSEPRSHEDLNDKNESEFYNNTTISGSSQQNSNKPSPPKSLNLDIQVELEVVYRGNLRLTVSTALILNKPTPAFMTLPIKLALKGISFKGVAVIAYIGKQINFCFKEPEESESLIEDVRLESELGDENKQVLKNISKIEGFLISKIKAAIDELLIFPNYHSIYISKDDD